MPTYKALVQDTNTGKKRYVTVKAPNEKAARKKIMDARKNGELVHNYSQSS